MPTPLLETKLYTPGVVSTSVPRMRLTERLDAGATARLLLVSAPAGFGKTTLLAQWLHTRAATAKGPSVAWVSLDAGDSDPVIFWTYAITALRTALLAQAPGMGASELQLLAAPDPPPVTRLLTTLLNDLGALGKDIVLVLDDYHGIEARQVHDGVAFLLGHAPPTLHLVIATRVDPPLSLARLRARGELAEIRAADLRFTPVEVAAYLNGPMGLALAPAQLAALEGRTEGWVAALQLAALSLQGRDDVAGFIGAFAGDDRYIVDYLVEEVLHRLPDHIEAFLVQTSVLDRLTGPLCDAVTGQAGGRTRLESLERANLFVVPLDDQRRWYRYHRLFADVLRARLLDGQRDHVPVLHQRASDWYENNGRRADAIHHAMAAGDYDRAADLTERTVPAARRDRREAALRGWLEQLPDDVIRARPVLSLAYAGALLSTGTVEGVEQHLAHAERWLSAGGDGGPDGPDDPDIGRSRGMVVADHELYRRLPGWVALYRAAQALMLGDTPATVASARHAVALLEDDDSVGQAAGSALLGLASWASGDLDAAHVAYRRCQVLFHESGYRTDILGCAITLADIRVTQGRLHDAMHTYQEALRLAAEPTPSAPGPTDAVLRGTADMYVGMSELHREYDELAAAARLLQRGQGLGELAGLPQCRYRWHVAMARLRQAEGAVDAALAHLDEAERYYDSDFGPAVRPVPAVRARMWLASGRRDDALGWVRSRGLSADDDLRYVLEYEHVTLARALMATFVRERSGTALIDATRLLARLLVAAEDGGRTGTVIELLTLQALALHHQGDLDAALRPLERALALAEPGGYVRIFLDEGPAMVELMEAAADSGVATGYSTALVARTTPDSAAPSAVTPVRREDAVVVEPLSDREHDVLRLLTTELGGPDIARELVLSLNTVRTHTRSIYAKLGVSNRRAAVRRAEELDLLRTRRGTRRAADRG